MTVKLLQLSDCHLLEHADGLYRGISPDANLLRCIEAANLWQPDLVLLSGDLADGASIAAYQRLAAYCQRLDCNIVAFPGNHDLLPLMKKHLQNDQISLQQHTETGGWQIVWLDSNLPQQPHGGLDADKLSILDDIDADTPTLLALHHQPIECQTPWIDRFKLQNPELLWSKLSNMQHSIRAITCGHIHHGWHALHEINDQTIDLYGAPATSACVLPGSVEFELDQRGPRMRWFLLNDDGQHSSGLLSTL